MNKLLVPQGTSQVDLVSLSAQRVENGVVLTQVLLIQEAGKPQPYQVQKTLVFENKNMEEALAEYLKAT